MKLNKPERSDLRKSHQLILDENADLRRKLEKLEASSSTQRDRLLVLASQIKLGFWEWDEVQKCPAFFSEEMANIFGITLKDLYDRYKSHKKFTSCIHPDDIQHYLDNMDLYQLYIMESGHLPKHTFILDYRIVRPDGEIRHLREIEYGVVKDNGTVIYSYGAIQDITEHRQSLTALKLSEKRYRSLISQMPIGVQEEDYSSIKKVVDKLRHKGVENIKEYLESHPEVLRKMVSNTHITSVNETLLKIHQAQSEQEYLEEEADIDAWWDAEWVNFYAAEIDGLAGPDKYYEAERKDTRIDGTCIETRSISTLVRGCEDSWSRVITMHEDITERKTIEVALIDAKRLAESASLAKSEFLSRMSHELRTPLNAILGFSQLSENKEGTSRNLQLNAQRINHAGKHLLTLINEILDLSQIESGEGELSMEPVSLVEAISDSITWVDAQAKSRQIEINFDSELLGDVRVEADANKLKQVFLNLLTNAVKYNIQGGSVSISCSEPEKGRVRISIKDTGDGISEDHLDELFQPFNRLGAESSSTEGTGIGLVITRKLVKMMNGQIDVNSKVGEGSEFWVEFPSAQSAKAKAKAKTKTKADLIEIASSRQPKLHHPSVNPQILVAEDNLINQQLIAAQLKSLGYNADYALNGAAALELWKDEKYDLLMTDIRMPVMDGIELVKQLRSMEIDGSQSAPIIAITANAMHEDVKRCRKAGVDAVIAKPVDLNDLGRVLKKWLPDGEIYESKILENNNELTSTGDEGINISVLQRSIGNNPEIHREVLSLYVDTLAEALSDIQTAFAWRNQDQLAGHAHKLKSSSRSMGANKLADLCHVIELASKENRWDEIDKTVPRLQANAKQVKEFVEVFCGDHAEESPVIIPVNTPVLEDEISGIKLSVLVVDDDYIMHKMIKLMLNDLGIGEVFSALSGPQGLEIIDNQQPVIDVVICDLNMPEMDGIEFTRHLAKRNYSGSLIITSGEDSRILKTVEKLALEHELQVLGIMKKPVTPTKLIQLLQVLDQVNSEKSIIALEGFSVGDLSKAINEGEIDTYFQPKIDVDTRKVVGVEALARWIHPTEGMISPELFIPLAEENNLIRELTLAVCKQALRHAVRLNQQGFDLNIAINISVDALDDLSWPDTLSTEIEAGGLQASQIILEITESRLMEHISVALDILSRLSLKRFNLSIDDFGTGYSSMEQLQRIPFSELKIDRAFVRGASEEASARAILESSVLLAKNLDMKVVAEGVETEEDWNLVTELGCDQVQGYYIAKPMPADQLYEWLGQWKMPEP